MTQKPEMTQGTEVTRKQFRDELLRTTKATYPSKVGISNVKIKRMVDTKLRAFQRGRGKVCRDIRATCHTLGVPLAGISDFLYLSTYRA